MKRFQFTIVYCLLTIALVQGANEIRVFVPGVSNCYSTVREIDGDVWYIVGDTFEVFGTGARTMADYDITLTDKSGDMFVGDFDGDISAGQYHIITYIRVGATAADTDPAVWQEYGTWDADEWFSGTLADVNDLITDMNDLSVSDVNTAVWTSLVADFTGELTFGGEVGGLDPNVTLTLADSNELQTDWKDGGRLDLLIDAIKYKTDLISLLDTVVKDANDANNFTIDTGTDVNDAYWFMAIIVEDANSDKSKEIRWIDRYDENSGDPNVWVDEMFSFTPATDDVVHIMGCAYGGYLYEIYQELKNSNSVTNVIDATGGGGRTVYGNTREDDFYDGLIPRI